MKIGTELSLLELLIFFLLIIPIIKAFIYVRSPLNGLAWLPPIALAVNIAFFPAYGFRLECMPLLLCNIALNIVNLRGVFNKKDGFYRPNMFHTVLALLVLSTTAFAVYFSPIQDKPPVNSTTKLFFDQERQKEFTVRLYPENASLTDSKGVIVVAPPFESIGVIDRICTALAKQGFLIIALSPPSPPLGEKTAFTQARIWGTSFEKANTLGRRFEDQKKEDLLFLLSRLELLVPEQDVPVFLVGYDAGGSAVYFLASEEESVKKYNIHGAAAVESRFWSLYYREEPTFEIPNDFRKRLMFNIRAGLAWLKPKEVNRIGTAPAPKTPFLFLTSDRIVDTAFRDKRYAAALKLLHWADAADTVLLAREGAGPFDYTDYPETHPLFSALNYGEARVVNGREWRKASVDATASVITEFIESALAGREFYVDGYYQESSRGGGEQQ